VTTRAWKKPACKRGHVAPKRTAHGVCILCAKDYRKENYARARAQHVARVIERAKANPEARRDQQRAVRMGVPVSEIRRVIARCEGRCEACPLPLTHAKMCVDHCHETGRIRGVLCRFCNALEGMLNKQPERIALLRAYIDREISRLERDGARR
jgi:hypothetical protein